MRLLFVTPELTPYSGATPTGEACWALPKALVGRGHEVTILSPLYGFVDPEARGLARRLRKVKIKLGEQEEAFTVFDARTAAGVDLLFLSHEGFLGGVDAVPLDAEDEATGLLFGAFAKAAVEVLRADDAGYDRVCCFDWQTGLVPMLVQQAGLEVPSIFAMSDVRRQGRFERGLLGKLGLSEDLFSVDGLEFYGKVCFLKGGVGKADRVTTVAPSYAVEVAEQADGFEGVLQARGKDFSGIAGGIDVAVWNPATDAHLTQRFDPMDLSGKRRCKAAMQEAVDLPVRDDVPLIVAMGPLHPSSGLDVLARIGERLMRNDVQLLVVAEGAVDPELVKVLEEHSERWPDRFQVLAEADTGTRHRALSAADLVLVPPAQAPGGSTQLRAHRYGALPMGLRSAAVADTVVDCDAKLSAGSGFLFDTAEDDVVLATMQRAVGAFATGEPFERIRSRALRADHGWDRAAYLYERLYASVAPAD